MTIEFRCPSCDGKLRMRDDAAGRRVRCRECRTPVRVPRSRRDDDWLDDDDYAETGPSFGRRPSESSGSLSLNVLLAIGGGAGLLVVLTAVVVAAVMRSGHDESFHAGSNQESAAVSNAPFSSSSFDRRRQTASISASAAGAGSDDRKSGRPLDSLPPVPQVTKPAGGFGNRPADSGQTADRRSATGGARWENRADAGGGGIQFDQREGLTFGPPGCPVLISGNRVWDLNEKQIRSELQGEYEGRGLTSLSPDGRWFAAVDKSNNQKDTTTTVWDTTTGQRQFVAPGHAERFTDLVQLTNSQLLIGGRSSNILYRWNLETGEEDEPLELDEVKGLQGKQCDISPDGDYIALPQDGRMVVIRLSSGKRAAVMAPPRAMERNPSPGGTAGRPARSNAIDAVFVYAWLQSVSFSPDLEELAAVSTHPRPRLMCWSNRGKLIYDEPFYTERGIFGDNTMQWFPNRSAWLIEHDVLDRESGQIVLSVREKFAQDLRLHIYDDSHLVGNLPHNPTQLEVLEIPWDDIRASLAAMKDDTPALLSPSTSVDIRVELAGLRGDTSQTLQAIEAALQSRLARSGMVARQGSPTYFRLKFTEQAGDTLPIYERQSPFDLRGRNTGRSATEAKGSMVVELIVPTQQEPVWRDSFSSTSSRSYTEEINDATVRESMLKGITRQINDLNFPYFIPESKELLALPVVIQ